MKIKKDLFFAVFMLMFLFSCTENPANLSVDEKSNVYEINAHNQTLEILSIAYAKALQEEEIRSIIKSEALKRFDGDYDVLHKTISEKKINGIQLNAILAKNVNSSGAFKSAIPVNSAFIDSLAAIIKNLQISVPVHCEKWNIDGFIPKVIFLPSNFSEKTFDKLKAYNADGSYEWVSTLEEPDVPYIVISPSERVGNENSINTTISAINTVNEKHTDGSFKSTSALPTVPDMISISYSSPLIHKLKWTPTDNETGYQVFMDDGYGDVMIGTTNYNECEFTDRLPKTRGQEYDYKVRAINNEGHSDWGKTMSIIASERTDNRRLRVTKLYMSKGRLGSVESWVSGAPEIRLYIVTVKGATVKDAIASNWYKSSEFEPNRRKDIQDTWWKMTGGGVNTDPWGLDDDINPRILNFIWVEEDWEDAHDVEDINVNWTVPFFNIECATKIKLANSKGEEIATFRVNWWDELTREYSDGGFKFDLSLGGQ
jgi:hypothetical protein